MVFDKKVLPSMRSMQFGGKPIEVSPNRIFNCAFMPVDDLRSFSEAMFLLLGGTGVGFSVQRHHVDSCQKSESQTRTELDDILLLILLKDGQMRLKHFSTLISRELLRFALTFLTFEQKVLSW